MKITIEPYEEFWKTEFTTLKNDLETILKDLSPRINHIGSTSIEGLSVKPIIDILIGVDSMVKLYNVI